jgi:hypothetical protein
MATCFNFSRCIKKQFKIYVYPNLHDLPQTKIYSNILSSVRESHFSTNNPSEACLFIPDFDSTDRDKIRFEYFWLYYSLWVRSSFMVRSFVNSLGPISQKFDRTYKSSLYECNSVKIICQISTFISLYLKMRGTTV